MTGAAVFLNDVAMGSVGLEPTISACKAPNTLPTATGLGVRRPKLAVLVRSATWSR